MNCKLKFLNLLKSEVIATRDDIDLDTDHEALGTLKNELDLVTHRGGRGVQNSNITRSRKLFCD